MQKYLVSVFNKIGIRNDKIMHFVVGCLICLCFGLLINAYIGLIAGLIAGICKEAYDRQDYGKWDNLDMVATWLGAFLGFVLVKFVA